ncbi:MAG TPA: RelA/SpoT domain-containing protein [Terriglobales bacterium]|nr:RelA/SpoT domain-containing protein [Terriglobales bacterium]
MNRAGRLLVEISRHSRPPELDNFNRAFALMDNWRSSHSYPLNVFQAGLRTRAKHIDRKSVIAQRLKRLSSIVAKLDRFPEMKLTQIQDIAGCRAIVSSVSQVYELVNSYKRSDIKHKLVHEDDYIKNPKESGYRSYHLVYRYYSDKKSRRWNDLKVEVQIRSPLQHAWATAVETVGIFIRHSLKSSRGDEHWLRFFALMGTAIALREHAVPVPNTPHKRQELRRELQEYAASLDVENRLATFNNTLKNIEEVGVREGHYFLIELDVAGQRTKVTSYGKRDLEKASEDYSEVERSEAAQDAVLVSVDSFKTLKRAYPNYFLDMRTFIAAVQRAISPRAISAPLQLHQPTLFDHLDPSQI